MAKYKKGDIVDFERASIIENDIPIIAVISIPVGLDGKPVDSRQWYIIEYSGGWLPDLSRIIQYELDADTKYLFVLEDELSQ